MNNKNFSTKASKYKLNNPHKYLGDPDNVLYRSSWEYSAFKFCDNNTHVIAWASEELYIPYMKPVFNTKGGIQTKPAKYYPDLYIEYIDKNGDFVKEIVEIKPKKLTKPSKSKKYATNLYENMIYAVNSAKFMAAKKWCEEKGIKFSIITEDSLKLATK